MKGRFCYKIPTRNFNKTFLNKLYFGLLIGKKDIVGVQRIFFLKQHTEYLTTIHEMGLVHCDLHGGNIVFDGSTSLICDLGLSRSANSRESNSTVQGVVPFIAPEVFHTCKFTQKADV